MNPVVHGSVQWLSTSNQVLVDDAILVVVMIHSPSISVAKRKIICVISGGGTVTVVKKRMGVMSIKGELQ